MGQWQENSICNIPDFHAPVRFVKKNKEAAIDAVNGLWLWFGVSVSAIWLSGLVSVEDLDSD
jgi:hypothetical protein